MTDRSAPSTPFLVDMEALTISPRWKLLSAAEGNQGCRPSNTPYTRINAYTAGREANTAHTAGAGYDSQATTIGAEGHTPTC